MTELTPDVLISFEAARRIGAALLFYTRQWEIDSEDGEGSRDEDPSGIPTAELLADSGYLAGMALRGLPTHLLAIVVDDPEE